MIAPDRHRHLDHLDSALSRIRRSLQLPGYRRRLLDGLGEEIPLGTLRLLRVIEQVDPGEPSIGEVAELLAVDPSTASRAVEDAVARGYLLRRPCTDDRRRLRLRLSDGGVVLLSRATAVRRRLLADVTAAWATEDLVELVVRLDRLTEDFDGLAEST